MAEQAAAAGTPDQNGADPIKNVKAEFDRKLGNMEGKISNLEQTNAALLSQLKSMAPQQTAAPAKKEPALKDVWYDDPDAAARKIKEEAKAELREELKTTSAQSSRQTQTLNALVQEFPELQDPQHDLTKRAIEIYTAMPEDEKQSPASYKAAVREAASEQGVKPYSKRDDVDSYTGVRGGSSGSSASRQPGRRGNNIAPETAEFARLMGLDITDQKVQERIKNNHGRKTYNRWE